MQLFLSLLTTVAFELVSSGTVLSPKHKPRVFVHVYLPGSEYQNPLHQIRAHSPQQNPSGQLLLAPLFNQLAPQVKKIFPTRPLVKCGRLTWKLSSSLYYRMPEGCRWECNRDSFLYFYSITGADLLQIGLSVYV